MDQSIRDLFPAARKITYLNTAAIGLLPVDTVKAVTSQLEDVAANGSANMGEWFAVQERVRALTASMLGAAASDVAFTRNTSDGLAAVASGVKWEPGDNIVSFAHEFPANYYPWRKLRDENGVELRLCSEQDGRMDVEELCSLIDGRTRLVAVSAVQYATGFRPDLERIGREARKADALFAVDMIQAFGAVPLDLPGLRVDIAAGASYKWLCAPQGCGILYLNERARQRMRPVSCGWLSVEDPWDFDSREQPFLQNTLGWETGTCGYALLYGLEQSLKLLAGIGIRKIAAYLRELSDYLCEILPTKRYSIISSRLPGESSQIVSIEPLNGLSAETVADELRRQNIVVSARGKRVRIAPHIFNNFDDIENLAACLP